MTMSNHDRPRPACLAPRRYWDGWGDAVTTLRSTLDDGLDAVAFDGIAGNEAAHGTVGTRSPIEVGAGVLGVMLDDIRRGRPDVLDHARVLVDYSPDGAAEALQLLAWLVAGVEPQSLASESL